MGAEQAIGEWNSQFDNRELELSNSVQAPDPGSTVKTVQAPLMICSVAVLAEETMDETIDKADSFAVTNIHDFIMPFLE